MRIKIKRSFRAVLSLLVTLMLLVGVMTQVWQGTKTDAAVVCTVYFDKNHNLYTTGNTAAWSGYMSVYIYYYDSSNTSHKVKMDWDSTKQCQYYGFASIPVKMRFYTNSSDDINANWSVATEYITDIENNMVYYTNGNHKWWSSDGATSHTQRKLYTVLAESSDFNATKDMNVIVDSASDPAFSKEPKRHYVSATLYDYFSDYEIKNGTTRTGGYQNDVTNQGILTPYTWEDPERRMQHLTFSKALSNYYASVNSNYQNPLYFGDIHHETNGYNFRSSDVVSNWGFLHNNTTNSDDAYKQLYHDNNSLRRNISGFADTDKAIPNVATTGLYKTSIGSYDSTKSNTENAQRLQLTNNAYARWFDDTWLSAGTGSTHNSTEHMIGASYNVDFPFWTKTAQRTINGKTWASCNYFYIDSEDPDHALRLHKENGTNKYYLKETGEGVYNFTGNDAKYFEALEHPNDPNYPMPDSLTSTYGFFPFNSKSDFYDSNIHNYSYPTQIPREDLKNLMDYQLRYDRTNYGFGTYMVIPFKLNENGTMYGTIDTNIDAPITFTFSGDDDLLVYVDGTLVLDIGGNHGKVQGEINFNLQKSWVSRVKSTTEHPKTDGQVYNRDGGSYNSAIDGDDKFYGYFSKRATLRDDMNIFTSSDNNTANDGVTDISSVCTPGNHTMEIFYVERGDFDSNMQIMYNLPIVEDRSFTVEQNITTPNNLDDIFTNASNTQTGDNFTAAANIANNISNIRIGTNVQFSKPTNGSDFSQLLGSQTNHGAHADRYKFDSEDLYAHRFGTSGSDTYTVNMGDGKKLTYVNDFVKPYNYNLKVSEGNIFIKTGTNPTGEDICRDTGLGVSDLFTTKWTLKPLSDTDKLKTAPNAGPATTATATTSGGSRPKRATKTTSTSATNNGFDFRGTQANPDEIVFENTMNTYTLSVSKTFIREDGDTAKHTFEITVEFNNVGGLNLEEINAVAPESGDGTTITKVLPFTFDSNEGTGTTGTTKTATAIVVPANTKYKVTETKTVSGYDVFDEVTGFTSPSGSTVSVTITNKPPEHNPIILKIQKIWENTDTLPASIKFKIEKSNNSGTTFNPMTLGSVVGADGNPITSVTFSGGDLTLNSNCQTTLGDGRKAWVAYIYDIHNLSDNTNVYRVTEYNGNIILNDNDTFKPGDVTFKVKYPNGDGLTNSGHYNSETQSGLTNPSGLTANYGNENNAGRILTLSVINRAFIKIRVQSYFTQTDEELVAATPSESPYVTMKVQRYNTSTSQWENVKNVANTDTSAVSITSAASTDTNPAPQRKYFEYVLLGEYDPDYQYRVLEYTQDDDRTPVENPDNANFNSAFTTINYSFDGGNKKNNREGTDLDKVVNNNVEEFVLMTDTNKHSGYGITLAVLNSGDGSSNTPETGGHGGYIPIAGGFIAILLAGAGYFIYKKRLFA